MAAVVEVTCKVDEKIGMQSCDNTALDEIYTEYSKSSINSGRTQLAQMQWTLTPSPWSRPGMIADLQTSRNLKCTTTTFAWLLMNVISQGLTTNAAHAPPQTHSLIPCFFETRGHGSHGLPHVTRASTVTLWRGALSTMIRSLDIVRLELRLYLECENHHA